MKFRAKVVDAAGKRLVLEREALDEAALGAELRAQGFIVAGIAAGEETAPGGEAAPGPRSRFRAPALDVEMGLRQSAAMLRSGMPLLEALETVADQSSRKRSRAVWRRIAAAVRSGMSLADALSGERRSFGEVAVRLAEVGERTGELEKTLARAADQMEARRNLKSALANALVYPAITVTMAIAVSAYLTVGVIPRLAEFLRSSGAVLPLMTQMLVDFSDWVVAKGLWVLAGVGAAAAAAWALRLGARGRELEDASLLRLPVVGGLLRLSSTALVARALQIMLEAGVTLVTALETAAKLIGNTRQRRRINEAAQAVTAGGTLSSALAAAREFLPMLARMAAVGEKTGALPEAFDETARFHEMMLSLAVKRLGIMIEPVMIAITGAIVGFVYVAFFMALFAIATVK